MIRTPACRFGASLLFVVLAAACSSGGSAGPMGGPSPEPEPAIPDISGQWSGFVSVEGQGIDGTLVVEQDGSVIEAVFQAPSFGLSAEGTGSITPEGEVELSLLYNLQCPGEARMDGDLSEDGLSIDGQIEAGDCTGSMMGSFRFTR